MSCLWELGFMNFSLEKKTNRWWKWWIYCQVCHYDYNYKEWWVSKILHRYNNFVKPRGWLQCDSIIFMLTYCSITRRSNKHTRKTTCQILRPRVFAMIINYILWILCIQWTMVCTEKTARRIMNLYFLTSSWTWLSQYKRDLFGESSLETGAASGRRVFSFCFVPEFSMSWYRWMIQKSGESPSRLRWYQKEV